MKCGRISGNLVITFRNYFEGDLTLKGTLPVSSKQGHLPGIGLSSIRRSVEKYGGSMAAQCVPYHNFVLTVALPIPETEQLQKPQTSKKAAIITMTAAFKF